MAMIEEWRVAVEWPAYEVSNLGRVRRCIPGMGTAVGRLLSVYLGSNGYLAVTLIRDGRWKPVCIHRLVATAFVPGRTGTRNEVNHMDFDKLNNAPANLEWVTHRENTQYTARHGLNNRGSAVNTAKLTERDVREIRRITKALPWMTAKAMRPEWRVLTPTLKAVIARRTWQHVS